MKYIHIVQFHLMSGGGVGSVLTDLCEAMAKQSGETYIISLFQRKGIDFQAEQAWAKEKGINVLLMQEKQTDSSLTVFGNLRRTIKQLSKEELTESPCVAAISQSAAYVVDGQQYYANPQTDEEWAAFFDRMLALAKEGESSPC